MTEARDASGAFYPLDTRLGRWAGYGPREVLDAIHADLDAFSGGVRRDDLAMLALRKVPTGNRRRQPGVMSGQGARRAAQTFSEW